MKKIYISGRITGIEQEAQANFEAAESLLRTKGYEPINPMKLDHKQNSTWTDYMRKDIQAMMEAEAIYFLRNADKSEGSKIEKLLACHLNIPIFYEEYPWMLDAHIRIVEVKPAEYAPRH